MREEEKAVDDKSGSDFLVVDVPHGGFYDTDDWRRFERLSNRG